MLLAVLPRTILTLTIFCSTWLGALALPADSAKKQKSRPCPRYYVGFSAGMNNPTGYFGISADVAITEKWSAATGIGMSTWGPKVFLEGRHYFKPCNRGWAAAGGFTYSFGSKNLHLPAVETIYGEQDVIIDQHAQVNAMITALYFFKLGRSGRNRFHVQLGYSIPLSGSASFDSDIPLSPDGVDQIEFLAPGGILVGIGFSFGFGAIRPHAR